MKNNQQAKNKNTRKTTKNLPYEKELISFIRSAQKKGRTKAEVLKVFNEYWKKIEMENYSLEENEEEKAFREKVKIFLDEKYEEFDQYAYKCIDTDMLYSWKRISEKNPEEKKEFVYELAGSIYKGFEMGIVDRKELKRLTTERTKILFPNVKSHAIYFDSTLRKFLNFVDNYVSDNEECQAFIHKFELSTRLDICVYQFVWLVENFQK